MGQTQQVSWMMGDDDRNIEASVYDTPFAYERRQLLNFHAYAWIGGWYWRNDRLHTWKRVMKYEPVRGSYLWRKSERFSFLVTHVWHTNHVISWRYTEFPIFPFYFDEVIPIATIQDKFILLFIWLLHVLKYMLTFYVILQYNCTSFGY